MIVASSWEGRSRYDHLEVQNPAYGKLSATEYKSRFLAFAGKLFCCFGGRWMGAVGSSRTGYLFPVALVVPLPSIRIGRGGKGTTKANAALLQEIPLTPPSFRACLAGQTTNKQPWLMPRLLVCKFLNNRGERGLIGPYPFPAPARKSHPSAYPFCLLATSSVALITVY